MQEKKRRYGRRWLWLLMGAVLLFYARGILWQTLTQLFYGLLVAMAALPLMRLLERRLRPGLAASLSLTGLGVGALAIALLLVPSLIQQARQLVALLPMLSERFSGVVQQGERWLVQNGLPVDETLRQQLAAGGERLLGKAAPAVLDWAKATAGGVSRWMLAPVLGFYFLKDRRQIGEWLLLLVPLEKRGISIRLLREIRREIAGYLRGQWMISLAVGGLTAVGLLLCGIPAWLLLGAVMGVMELIPYVGPLIGGGMVLLFSLQAGTGRMLWALAVVLVVQQLEGSWLSPQMMSDATRLHPVVVLLCIMAGGTLGGMGGILLAVPALLCLRAVVRVYLLSRAAVPPDNPAFVKER